VLRPESNKDAIKALVSTYTDQASQGKLFSADFIQNKGEGQVILLHGPPGTGKTLTAESVAEFTRKPLVSITAADLGHEPQDLERNLTRFLKNAHVWGAVVLLDEADIYLQRRSAHDLKRNSIVSIFLRLLDYFQGILFLTSNRVGQIDEAFMSRIHIALGYSPLDNDARSTIWDNLFRKIQDDYERGGARIRHEYDAKQYVKKSSEVLALQWNGREIRNAFQTVVALATADAKKAAVRRGEDPAAAVPEIREAHLRQVVLMSAAFKEYMKATHDDLEDPDHALVLGNRDDRFYQKSGGS
jgi:SpoVK/Ycf46/Vps4 family AAA+-type ATPase